MCPRAGVRHAQSWGEAQGSNAGSELVGVSVLPRNHGPLGAGGLGHNVGPQQLFIEKQVSDGHWN